MSDNTPEQYRSGSPPARRDGPTFVGTGRKGQETLADILERVLDKGIVIVGDIQVRLLDIELLTIKIRLMVASVERAKEMGINWWEGDPFVSHQVDDGPDRAELQNRVGELEQRLARIEGRETGEVSRTERRA